MVKRWRVAHVGTGRTGLTVLRLILRTSGLELVGQYVNSPDKVGRDSGELVGDPAANVLATGDFDAFLAVDADCVSYAATAAGRAMDEVVDQICAILASGKNVVTIMPEFSHPPALGQALLARLRTACQTGGTALLSTGIAPGFAIDVLPVQIATMCNRPTKVTVSERILCGSYSVPGFFAALGFGTTAEVDAKAYRPGTGAAMFGCSLQLMAQSLGWTLDEIRDRKEVAVALKDYSFAAGEVLAGTIISVRVIAEGIVDGDPRLTISEAWTLTDDVVDDWDPRPTPGSPPRLTHIAVDGTPAVTVDLTLEGNELPGVDATAARAVNAIDAVCSAQPGVYGALDLAITPRLSAAIAQGIFE